MPATLIQIFIDAVQTYRKPAQFMRKVGGAWESIPADRALSDVQQIALGLAALGIQHGDRVGILSENRYEWPVSDLAILSLGAVTVPIYPTLTGEQCALMLRDAGVKVLFVSSADQLSKMLAVKDRLPKLSTFIALDAVPAGGASMPWSELMRRGAELRRSDGAMWAERVKNVRPDDLATIIYTSGTTGEPKGAMLLHSNIASNVEASLQVIKLTPEDTCLSFLPLCHILERTAGLYAMLQGGVTIAYAQAPDTVADDAIEVRPTLLVGVPRFFEKVCDRVMKAAESFPPIRRALFDWGLGAGRRAARAFLAGTKPGGWTALQARIADRIVHSKIRARVGGRLHFCISGGAPLNPDVMEFFYAIGIPVYEGYGLTETSPVICLNPARRPKPGCVGPAIPGVEVKIAENGEILTRGPHVMKGYFNNPEATARALAGGWFHTGDVGELDADGYLKITDRLKEIIVLAGGKKVAPQPIENRLKSSEWIAEAVLIGDKRPYIACLIVPDFARARALAPDSNGGVLSDHPKVIEAIQQAVDVVNASLARFEQIKRFSLLERELTQEAGELTPSLKIKRRAVNQRYAQKIERLYEGQTIPPSAPGSV